MELVLTWLIDADIVDLVNMLCAVSVADDVQAHVRNGCMLGAYFGA